MFLIFDARSEQVCDSVAARSERLAIQSNRFDDMHVTSAPSNDVKPTARRTRCLGASPGFSARVRKPCGRHPTQISKL